MNKIKSVLFVAGISLALGFAFSCSGDSGGSGTEISSSSTNENGSVKKDHISGLSQKGPFMKGSTAVLYELDDKLVQTGRSFRDIIADDKGSFDIKINVELVSPYAMLEVDGYYRNEVTGNPSTGTIKLYAIADIREKSNVNVNILTHLEYYRVQKLVEEGKSLKEAKEQAQNEILAVFGISGSFENSEDMSIFGTTEGDAALLAISVLLQGYLSEGQFVERLTDFRLGFRETGTWDSKTAKDAIADWVAEANIWGSMMGIGSTLGIIRGNILGWKLSSAVPDFEKFVNNYWYANYGLGVCDEGLRNVIKNSNRGVDYYYICKSNAWTIATEYERDTYQWVCVEGEIKAGQVSGIGYICKNNAWVTPTLYELDTYQWVCVEGEVKDGQATRKKYICKDDSWVIATEYEGDTYQWVCVEGEIKDGQATRKKYICKNNAWVTPTEYELDTYQWVCVEGEVKAGQASGKKYVCKYEIWRIASYKDIVCFEEKNCNYFTDTRDNQRYYYVAIGKQIWMAENLNYNAPGSKCGNGNSLTDANTATCDTYGRLYDWETAIALPGCNTKNCASQIGAKHQGVCPAGWHLPSVAEIDALIAAAGGSSTAGKNLKAKDGWTNCGPSGYYSCEDTHGFSALPGGFGRADDYSWGGTGDWWSASENMGIYAYSWRMYNSAEVANDGTQAKYYLFYVRCLLD